MHLISLCLWCRTWPAASAKWISRRVHEITLRSREPHAASFRPTLHPCNIHLENTQSGAAGAAAGRLYRSRAWRRASRPKAAKTLSRQANCVTLWASKKRGRLKTCARLLFRSCLTQQVRHTKGKEWNHKRQSEVC